MNGTAIAVPPSQEPYAFNLASAVSVTVDGQGKYAYDGAGMYRGFFDYAGQLTLQNITIQNALAQGGSGSGSGGGAGLGSGLFVAMAGAATLRGVTFTKDEATGGSGGGEKGFGGGGGLGGNGGNGGGGGVGRAANAGTSPGGGPGLILGEPGGNDSYFGGGGGNPTNQSGGGVSSSSNNGGFGGGGDASGIGGYGGGGGGRKGSNGGFGGGGGSGGFGGVGFGGSGGGGRLGAGADVFVQQGGTLNIADGTLGAGMVMPGTAGSGGTAGAALGSGLFIQGNQSVTLNPGAGQTTTVSGVIADEAGSQAQLTTGQGSDTGTGGTGNDQGSLIVGTAGIAGGLVTLAPVDSSGNAVANSYTGGTALNGGTLELAAQGAAGSTQNGNQTAGGVAFGATGTTLQIDGAAFAQPQVASARILAARPRALALAQGTSGTYAAPVTNFAQGETLDLRGLRYVTGTTLAAYTGGNTLTVMNGAATETLTDFTLASGVPAGSTFVTTADANGGTDVTLLAPAPTPSGGNPTPAANPTITGTHATADAGEGTVTPFGTSTTGGPVTIGDTNANPMDSLTITLSGGGGTLSGTGLSGSGTSYSLAAATPANLSAELDALTFMPTAGQPGLANPTTFALAVASNAGMSATDSNTVVTDTAAAVPVPTPVTPTPVTPTPVAPTPVPVAPGSGGVVGVTPADAVSLSPQVTYKDGVFTLAGTASSAAGVTNVEITATVGGRVRDLGPAALNGDGTFSFQDAAGQRPQGFITATETDGMGVTTSAQADYSLTGGLSVGPYTARETSYTADGSAVLSRSLFRDSGQRAVDVDQGGQTLQSAFKDHWNNHGAPESTFVFTPGYGQDVINLFRVDGSDHDSLSFKGSDFGTDPASQLAAVLANTQDAKGGAVITDPTTKETVQLLGISAAKLQGNPGDFSFHA